MVFGGNGINEGKVEDAGYSENFTDWLEDKTIPEINSAFVNAVAGPDEINPEWMNFMYSLNNGGAPFADKLVKQLSDEGREALADACREVKQGIFDYRESHGLDVSDFRDAKPFYDKDGHEAQLPELDKKGNIIEESVDNINQAMSDREAVFVAMMDGP